jgi:type II secretory pathway component GspD/PulD (secretin)
LSQDGTYGRRNTDCRKLLGSPISVLESFSMLLNGVRCCRRMMFACCAIGFAVLVSAVPANGQDDVVIEESETESGELTPPTTETPGSITPATGMPPVSTPAPAEASVPPAAENAIKRPPAEKYVPQKIDTEIRKNPNGHVAFSIIGQPWEAVLQWLADASALSLDWQELPGDSLNLITTHEYSMEEARDLINRHLLMRGFTMIVNGEVMSIVRIKDLNSAMVVRVSPKDLATLPDHSICKVSFNLDWLVADEAVEELKPMLSSAGQIHKLSKTNRLEILDTAISLRHIWELLQDEQSESGDDQLVRAFLLEHRRAEDVIRLLRELLKLQSPPGEADQESGGGMNPDMVMQMMQQMQQTMQQATVQPGTGGAKVPKETRLVLNQRENTILAIAEPDQMAVIERAVKEIDVPRSGDDSLLQNVNRMKIYRLESVDPQTLVDLLQQLGGLDPGTMLKVDKSKKSIMAWATLSDHLTITTLVEKMDQSSRQFEVIPLKRLDAEYVAGTIRMLFDAEPKEENQNQSRQFYGYFDFNQPEEQKEKVFRIEADIENNRLLVNANAIEMDEIRTLLMKLGELTDPNATDDGVRVFEINADEDLQELQQRLQQYWRRGNRLEFDLPKESPKVEEDTNSPDDDLKKKEPAPDLTRNKSDLPRVFVWKDGRRQSARLAQVQVQEYRSTSAVLPKRDIDETDTVIPPETTEPDVSPPTDSSEPVETEPLQESETIIDRKLLDRLRRQLQDAGALSETPESSDSGVMPRDVLNNARPDHSRNGESPDNPRRDEDQVSPIKFSITPDGKLIVSSKDLAALAAMEDLIGQVAAPRRSYKIFRLKYATPSWVTLNLKDFFKSEEQTKSGFEYDPWFGITPSQKKTSGKHSLSKRRQPQFISDNFTSTILVRDADTKQLQTIEDLISIYDVPEPSDSRSMRVTTIFRLKHARAGMVAAAVKDVFRDLLSSNDKALEADDKGQRQSGGGLVTFLPGSSSKSGESDDEDPIRFKGLLSMGIDDSSNTLIVSSSGSLMDTIGEMIESLDEAANSSSIVQVMHVDRTVDLGMIQERLRELMTPAPGAEQPGQQQPGQPQPGLQPGEQPGQPGVDAAIPVE